MRYKKIRRSLLRLLTWLVILSQLVTPAAYADIKTFYKPAEISRTLAVPSIWKPLANEGYAISEDLQFLVLLGTRLLYKNEAKSSSPEYLRYVNKILNNMISRQSALKHLGGVDFENPEWNEDKTELAVTFKFNNKPDKFRITYRHTIARDGRSVQYSDVFLKDDIYSIEKIKAAPEGMGTGEPLIGHGFTDVDLDRVKITPWPRSEAFSKALQELEEVIKERAPDRLRSNLLSTLADFKAGEDGRRLGIAPACYIDRSHYYIEFATASSIGIAEEFFKEDSEFYPFRIAALFHALFHAWRHNAFPGETGFLGENDAHNAAMRLIVQMSLTPEEVEAKIRKKAEELYRQSNYAQGRSDENWRNAERIVNSGLLFWDGLITAQDKLEASYINPAWLEAHQANRFGQAIRLWKLKHVKLKDAVVKDDWKELKTALSDALATAGSEGLIRLLLGYNKTINTPATGAMLNQSECPIESRYPLLKAVALLTKDEQVRLNRILTGQNPVFRRIPIIDSILLMLNPKIPEDWLSRIALNMVGRSVWFSASEIWHAGGGLGRVSQFRGIRMQELLQYEGLPLKQVEPRYNLKVNAQGQLAPVDYAAEYGITGIEKIDEFQIHINSRRSGGEMVDVVCERGYKDGIEVYLIHDKNHYYTKMLYGYESANNPVSWEEFSEFISKAKLELVRRQEEKARAANPAWKPPVLHMNDAQLALAIRYIKKYYASDPVLSRALTVFMTHTYRNRQVYGEQEGKERLRRLEISSDDEMELYSRKGDIYDRDAHFVPIIDISSGGVREADLALCVSAHQRGNVIDFDKWGKWKDLEEIAASNGDARELTAEKFRAIMTRLYPKIDVEHPMPWQVLETKREAKRFLGLNDSQYVVAYTGRVVAEKISRYRLFTDHNIKELVKAGVQVVIGANVESNGWIVGDLERLARDIDDERAADKEKYPGRFVVMRNIDVNKQREIFAALDIHCNDSDPNTEAAGATECNAAACGGLVLAPPWREGLLQAQGIVFNFDVPGEGNILIPKDGSPDSYLEILIKATSLPPEMLAKYQANSIRISRVVDARLTVAEELRQYDAAIAEKEGGKAARRAKPQAPATNMSRQEDPQPARTYVKTITMPDFSGLSFKDMVDRAPTIEEYFKENEGKDGIRPPIVHSDTDELYEGQNTYNFPDGIEIITKKRSEPYDIYKVIEHKKIYGPKGDYEGGLLAYYHIREDLSPDNPGRDNAIVIVLQSADKYKPVVPGGSTTRGQENWDRAVIKLYLDGNRDRISMIHYETPEKRPVSLSRTTMGILLNDAKLEGGLKTLHKVLKEYLVFPEVTDEVRSREAKDEIPVPLDIISRINAAPGKTETGDIETLEGFAFYKSWTVREKALNALRALKDAGRIPEERLFKNEAVFEAFHIEEDLLFIERLLIEKPNLIHDILFNLYGINTSKRGIDKITIKWFNKGANKNVFYITFTLKDGRAYSAAVSTVRDNPANPSFDWASIKKALENWQKLSDAGSKAVPKVFAYDEARDFRPRMTDRVVKSIRGAEEGEPVSMDGWIRNDILLVFREFVDGKDLAAILFDPSISPDEKTQMKMAAVQTCLDIWNETKDEAGKGLFVGDPKPANIVVSQGVGAPKAKDIDLDLLREFDSLEAIKSRLRTYPEYDELDVIYEDGKAKAALKNLTPPGKEITAEAVTSEVKESTDLLKIHLSERYETKVDLTHTFVIMKKNLAGEVTGAKGAILNMGLVRGYQVMRQDIRNFFNNGKDIIKIDTPEVLVSRMNALMEEDPQAKIIILDDGTLTKGFDPAWPMPGLARGEAGKDYCAVTVDAMKGLDVTAIPFINLNAMVMMGIGILYRDTDKALFEMAYEAFTGRNAQPELLDEMERRELWIIKALPRIVRFSDELKDSELLRKLFAAAA